MTEEELTKEASTAPGSVTPSQSSSCHGPGASSQAPEAAMAQNSHSLPAAHVLQRCLLAEIGLPGSCLCPWPVPHPMAISGTGLSSSCHLHSCPHGFFRPLICASFPTTQSRRQDVHSILDLSKPLSVSPSSRPALLTCPLPHVCATPAWEGGCRLCELPLLWSRIPLHQDPWN